MASYQLNTAPVIEPLTLAEAKVQLDIPTVETFWDTYIGTLITSARETAEKWTYRGLLTQTWTLWLDPNELVEIIEISKVPIQSLTHIKYYNSSNVLTTMDSGNYYTDFTGSNVPARIQLKSIPAVYDRINAVEVKFVCGWTSAALVPEPIKSAMKLIIGHLYEHRDNVVLEGSPAEIPMGAAQLLQPYSMNWFYRSV